MGDRWFSGYLRDSRYVWLPIEFDAEGYISIKKYSNWDLSIFSKIKPFKILTNLPTEVNSVSDLKNSLPSSIIIQYIGESTTQTVTVEWSFDIDDNSIADISITGSLSIERSIIHNVQIFDKRTIYFFDSGAGLYGNGDYYTNLKAKLGSKLLNNEGDQAYIKGTQAGYSSSLGGTDDNVDISYKGTGNDIWSHGFWEKKKKNIVYSFELKAGTYYVNEGFFEWWNTQRYMKITVSAGGKEITNKTFTLGKSDTRNQQSVKFSLTSTQIVTVSVSKTSGSDPVLSWISILQEN